VREHGGATPAHRATPRLARSRPDPRQPRKPLERPRTRTQPPATRRPHPTRRRLGHRPPQKPKAATITPAPPARIASPVVAVDFEVDFDPPNPPLGYQPTLRPQDRCCPAPALAAHPNTRTRAKTQMQRGRGRHLAWTHSPQISPHFGPHHQRQTRASGPAGANASVPLISWTAQIEADTCCSEIPACDHVSGLGPEDVRHRSSAALRMGGRGGDLTQRVDLVARALRPARAAAIQVRLEQ